MNNYKKRIEDNVMMMDLRTAKIVILMIKIEIRDVLNIAVHIVMDLVQDVN
jgi:hypothetical protein